MIFERMEKIQSARTALKTYSDLKFINLKKHLPSATRYELKQDENDERD